MTIISRCKVLEQIKTHLKVIILTEGSYCSESCDVFKILKQTEVACLLLKSQSPALKERMEARGQDRIKVSRTTALALLWPLL